MIAGKAKVFKKIYPFNMRKTDDDQTGLIKWWQDHPDDIELDYDELLFSNANFWNKDHEKGCPYKISKNYLMNEYHNLFKLQPNSGNVMITYIVKVSIL